MRSRAGAKASLRCVQASRQAERDGYPRKPKYAPFPLSGFSVAVVSWIVIGVRMFPVCASLRVTNVFDVSMRVCEHRRSRSCSSSRPPLPATVIIDSGSPAHQPEECALGGDTIIGVPFEAHHALRSLLQDQPGPEEAEEDDVSLRLFKIRSADSFGQRSSASILVNRMYATRGYRSTPMPDAKLPTRITLVASEHEETIGTITVGFDCPTGLHVDDLFANETAVLRDAGHHICEFTKLAIDSVVRSKRVLASLFHVAYIYAYRTMGYDSLLIEVNPRHVRYYERMLGFQVIGQKRLNKRVNAPAVLLCLDFAHAQNQIDKFGGKPEFSLVERSLYPYFFSVSEEVSIVARLKLTQSDSEYVHTGSDLAQMGTHPHCPSTS